MEIGMSKKDLLEKCKELNIEATEADSNNKLKELIAKKEAVLKAASTPSDSSNETNSTVDESGESVTSEGEGSENSDDGGTDSSSDENGQPDVADNDQSGEDDSEEDSGESDHSNEESGDDEKGENSSEEIREEKIINTSEGEVSLDGKVLVHAKVNMDLRSGSRLIVGEKCLITSGDYQKLSQDQRQVKSKLLFEEV